MAFKDKSASELMTFEQVKSLPEFAGILAPEIILIDIDDSDTSELLFKIVKKFNLKCRVYQTTRGKHFLFKNSGVASCKTNTNLAIGLLSDIKLGSRNSYSILKFNGQDRKILLDCKEDEVSELPKWLFPIKANMPFLTMEVGDGRNNALFTYELTLQSNDFSIEESRQCIQIINDFVLKVPLSQSELDVILRDDAFKKPVFFKGSTFLHDKFATYMKNNNHIIKVNNQLHLYKDGIYVSGQSEIESAMIQHISSLNRSKRTEVMSYLDVLIRSNTKAADANLIAFRNGVYDISTDAFRPGSPDMIITNRIPWDYNPQAQSELADSVLNNIACQDEQIRLLLDECVGYCFYRRNESRKAFILIGDKRNGKSTFLDMIKTLLGDENIAALDLKELGDRFKTAELFGKLANIGDDIGNEFIANAAVFKKLVTGDRVSVERKGQNPFEFNNYSKFLFSANSIPRIKDKTGAVLDRLIIVPFNAVFDKSDPNFKPFIKYELQTQEVMEYLALLGIQGLKRILENRGFTTSAKVQQQLDDYEESNNPILGFIAECKNEEFQIENEPTKKVYKRYNEYCIANNYQPLANNEFPKQLNRLLNLQVVSMRKDNKVCRVFIPASAQKG